MEIKVHAKSACDECLQCLLEEVSRLELSGCKDEESGGQGYKDHVAILGAHAGRRVPTRTSHTLGDDDRRLAVAVA